MPSGTCFNVDLPTLDLTVKVMVT